ncbi:unnamed protein product [Meloidogyne enterolobii]|uniref:Uncharacterized protein n=1 Tax=Meloidogyne enterolobii TaxID=390850 RepID=A0ACB0XXG2_MELEN
MEKLEELDIYSNDFVVEFTHNNCVYSRSQMLKPLRAAERENDIIYPANFRVLTDTFNVIQPFLLIIFYYPILPSGQTELTIPECYEIINKSCNIFKN